MTRPEVDRAAVELLGCITPIRAIGLSQLSEADFGRVTKRLYVMLLTRTARLAVDIRGERMREELYEAKEKVRRLEFALVGPSGKRARGGRRRLMA